MFWALIGGCFLRLPDALVGSPHALAAQCEQACSRQNGSQDRDPGSLNRFEQDQQRSGSSVAAQWHPVREGWVAMAKHRQAMASYGKLLYGKRCQARTRTTSTTPQFGHDSYRLAYRKASADYTPSPFANHDVQRPSLLSTSLRIFPANTSAAYAVQPVRSGVRGSNGEPSAAAGRNRWKEPERLVEPLFAFPGRVETPWACCIPSSPVPGAWE
jgi:hypothetical protein